MTKDDIIFKLAEMLIEDDREDESGFSSDATITETDDGKYYGMVVLTTPVYARPSGVLNAIIEYNVRHHIGLSSENIDLNDIFKINDEELK